jgi:hypothetical protein
MGTQEDHDLLIRIDARLEALQKQMDAFMRSANERMTRCEEAIVGLRVNSAKWGAIAGIMATVLGTLAIAGVRAMAGQ